MYANGGNGYGTTIHHNWAHDSWAGVYVDFGQYNYYVYCNLCYSNYVGMQFNQFSNNLIINNTTASNSFKDIQFNGSSDANVKLINNIWDTTANTYGTTVVSNNGWYPPLAANFVPAAGSGAINGGIVYAPYTDGYVGSAPDIGAFVGGTNTYWIPGANFVPGPFPRSGTLSSNYQSAILADNPVSYWPLNETNGTVINDIAGTNDGTAMNTNGLTLGVPGVLYSNGVPTDTAISFNNTNNGYISVPYSSTLNTTNFSVEAWLHMPTFPANAQSANENPLSFCNGNTPHGWTFDIQVANGANPDVYSWAAKGGSAWNSVNSGVAIQSEWSYYVMTFNGTTLTIYTNGVSATSANVTNYTMVSSGQYLFMGDYNDGANSPDTNRFYQGSMERVAVYDYALTGSQITSHYYYGTNFPAFAAPSIATQPASQTNNVGQTNTFIVNASGTAPLSYQWQMESNGSYLNLSSGGQFSA